MSPRWNRLVDLYHRALDEGRNQAFWDSYLALSKRDRETFDNATAAAQRGFMGYAEINDPPAGISKAPRRRKSRS